MRTSALSGLTRYLVRPKYGRRETSLDIFLPDGVTRVARLYKPSRQGGRRPYQLLTGPGLTEVDGAGLAWYFPLQGVRRLVRALWWSTYRFRAPDSPGFAIRARTVLTTRYQVTVYDQRYDPRVVLAALVHLDEWDNDDVRQDVITLTT